MLSCCGVKASSGHIGDRCQPSADHHHHHKQQQHQPIYNRIAGSIDDSVESSIDIQSHSSAASSLTSQRPQPQLTRWKPVSNIPERWSREMMDPAAAGCCESMMKMQLNTIIWKQSIGLTECKSKKAT